MFANRDCLPYSVRYRATPIPIGIEISVASPTISSVPRIALRIPPGLPKKLPLGSVVKKPPGPRAQALLEQVVDDQDQRDQRDQRAAISSTRAHHLVGAPAAAADLWEATGGHVLMPPLP